MVFPERGLPLINACRLYAHGGVLSEWDIACLLQYGGETSIARLLISDVRTCEAAACPFASKHLTADKTTTRARNNSNGHSKHIHSRSPAICAGTWCGTLIQCGKRSSQRLPGYLVGRFSWLAGLLSSATSVPLIPDPLPTQDTCKHSPPPAPACTHTHTHTYTPSPTRHTHARSSPEERNPSLRRSAQTAATMAQQ
jgi:hypothetical protein